MFLKNMALNILNTLIKHWVSAWVSAFEELYHNNTHLHILLLAMYTPI